MLKLAAIRKRFVEIGKQCPEVGGRAYDSRTLPLTDTPAFVVRTDQQDLVEPMETPLRASDIIVIGATQALATVTDPIGFDGGVQDALDTLEEEFRGRIEADYRDSSTGAIGDLVVSMNLSQVTYEHSAQEDDQMHVGFVTMSFSVIFRDIT